jgi:D-alanyl-lipoteichoic acid acyltransferase DltB (MBOAT superfamily)
MTLTIFSALYILCVCALFYLIQSRFRVGFLALSAICYVFLLSVPAGLTVTAVTLFAWGFGLLIGIPRLRSIFSTLGVALCVAFLLLMKSYARFPFLQDETSPLHRFILPIGFSFYIFQVISYFVDLHRGTLTPEKDPLKMLLYLAWFPKFISGPIERKADFDKQLENVRTLRFYEPGRWSRVFQYVLIGVFYKVVIADRLGIYVDRIWESYTEMGSISLLFGALLYSFQIYCDFAGYSYAAIGFSLLFGIRLTDNFLLPYQSKNISEFWRRWHYSLSSWLRDYLYIPLGGNRKGTARKVINTLIVFFICGLWHGESLNFVAWGMLHGFFSAADVLLSDASGWHGKLRSGLPGQILTFLAVTFAWIFFRADALKVAIDYILHMLSAGISPGGIGADFRVLFPAHITDLVIMCCSILLLMIVEYLAELEKKSVPALIIGKPYYVQYAVDFLLITGIMILGIYGPAHDTARMIYMQF